MTDYCKLEAQARTDRIRLFYEELDDLCLEGTLKLEDQQLKGMKRENMLPGRPAKKNVLTGHPEVVGSIPALGYPVIYG